MAHRNSLVTALTRKARTKAAQRRYAATQRVKRIPIPPNDPKAIRQWWEERGHA